jgi:glyoxylase-like metal-dependent hydrolase (beta-lactamase superfamily II)/ferredoxin
MASLTKILQINVKGEFFVDSACIDCGACRQIAPEVFAESGGYSYVYSQPKNEIEKVKAFQALLSCPVGAIGMTGEDFKFQISRVIDSFPVLIEDDVFYCGFNSEKSFGASSYFVQNSNGNWLIESPRFVSHLIKKFEMMGGISYIFLTHRDDVADAEKFASHFKAKTIIHERDKIAIKNPDIIIKGDETIEIAPDFVVIPTPGHTSGHCVLLYKNKFLFTGDHLWWSSEEKSLSAGRDVCWYSWDKQIESMEKLIHFNFEWLLPSHGQRIKLPVEVMKEELKKLAKRMRKLW